MSHGRKMPSGSQKHSDILQRSGLTFTKWSNYRTFGGHCCLCWVGGLSYKFNNDDTPDKTALSGQNQEVSVLFVTSQRSAPQNCALKHKLP